MKDSAARRYQRLGLGLAFAGGLFALATWLAVGYMPLVALGAATTLLGAVSLALSRTLPPLSPETSLLLLEAGADNVTALVEELGLRSRALYLPASMVEGPPAALIPLDGTSEQAFLRQRLERRLIVRYGSGPADFGVLVATPGSAALRLRDLPAGALSGELETALSTLLVGTLDLAESVRVQRDGERVTVEVARPSLPWRDHPAYRVLGSPLASIVATVTAQLLDRPVRIVAETDAGRRRSIALELVGTR